MKQEYKFYTEADHKVWSILFTRQVRALKQTASKEFLEGLKKVNFRLEAIPDFEEVNSCLAELTGWQLEAVPGIIPDRDFFELLSRKNFCATTCIWKMEQLDYLEEPDMFHDVFGHVPLLSNKQFCDFLQGLSHIALDFIGNEYIIHLLSRIYWYTVEFGLIQENGQLKIYGAGILSSIGESEFALSGVPRKIPFSVGEIVDTLYRKDAYQEKYFVISSYQQLYDSLPEIRTVLQEKLAACTIADS